MSGTAARAQLRGSRFVRCPVGARPSASPRSPRFARSRLEQEGKRAFARARKRRKIPAHLEDLDRPPRWAAL